MKKFTALMLVAICLVIGGVYASWTYATGNMEDTVAKTVNPTIDAVTGDTPVGKLTVVTQDLAINITDNYDGENPVANNTPGDYIAEVNYTGSLVVKFVASANASEQIQANGLKLQVTFTFEGDVFSANTVTLTSAEYGTYAGADGTFTWTISAEDLGDALTFNGGQPLKLATLAEYNAFAAELEDVSITLTVAQNGNPTAQPAQSNG